MHTQKVSANGVTGSNAFGESGMIGLMEKMWFQWREGIMNTVQRKSQVQRVGWWCEGKTKSHDLLKMDMGITMTMSTRNYLRTHRAMSRGDLWYNLVHYPAGLVTSFWSIEQYLSFESSEITLGSTLPQAQTFLSWTPPLTTSTLTHILYLSFFSVPVFSHPRKSVPSAPYLFFFIFSHLFVYFSPSPRTSSLHQTHKTESQPISRKELSYYKTKKTWQQQKRRKGPRVRSCLKRLRSCRKMLKRNLCRLRRER